MDFKLDIRSNVGSYKIFDKILFFRDPKFSWMLLQDLMDYKISMDLNILMDHFLKN